ncbi:SusC/RagA family TonB-linked outer membrane protein [Arachidicoccus terrestris]|uniref:SusC/RagA family TonB-linked outer membrane protein n=1 Tax=Arachidicoccus terrestris TaxID=2875539 RepID=UPI001CC48871|nr:TonB-dependent receptor [Arachidicoccus terrestris]UAY54546.1 TonB-dependent receptor [Arachidicoccus terrestris]
MNLPKIKTVKGLKLNRISLFYLGRPEFTYPVTNRKRDILKPILLSLWMAILLLIIIPAEAQNGMVDTLHGNVYNQADGTPVFGASVTIKGTTQGTLTDSAGNFRILTRLPVILTVTDVSHLPQEVPINDNKFVSIGLQASTQSLNDVVVVGYGEQQRGQVTGAVSTVDVTKTFRDRPLNDPIKALQGVVPGLAVSYSNGGLTSAATIRIRGVGSLVGSGSPLIMVDNVETDDLSVLNPDDIESVSVLKDAASTAIYGARAAFGVILIKTRSGRKNQPTSIRYSNNFYWSNPTILPDFADPTLGLPGLIKADERSGVTPELFGMNLNTLLEGIKTWKEKYAGNRTSDEMIPGEDFDITDDAAPYFYRIWDVKKMMLRTQPGQQHNIRISGGSDNIAYYVSAGYSKDGGIMRVHPDQVQKYNISTGVSANVTKWWDLNVKMLYRNFEYDYPFGYYGATQNYFYYMWRWGAYWPYGTYQGKYFRNIPAYLNAAQDNTVIDNYSRVDLSSNIKITKDLNLHADYSIVRDNVIRQNTGGPVMAWNSWTVGAPYQNISSSGYDYTSSNQMRDNMSVFNAYATYDKHFEGKHHLKLMAGINAQNNNDYDFTAKRMEILDPTKGYLSLASGEQYASDDANQAAFAGYFGRVNYDYNDKYLLELDGRYDGSSSFAEQDRWSFFSSGSVGYRISKERFMDFIKPFVSDWKFRASYGAIGNQDLGGDNRYLPLMNAGAVDWVVDGVAAQGVGAPNAVAKSLTWEKITTLNIGTDISMLNDKISLSLDWFQRTNDGMLTQNAVANTFGTTAPWINDGTMRTRGWELSVNGNLPVSRDLAFYGSLTLTDYKTVITKWDNASKLLSQNYSGQTYGDIWGFETDRYFTDNDFDQDGNYATGIADQSGLASGNFKYGPGDVKFKDQDGNGVIDGGDFSANNPGDLKVIGNTQPRYMYSFRIGGVYRNLDFDFFFQGVGKQSYWGTGDVAMPNFRGGDILYAHQLDYWTPENTDARYPNPYAGNGSGKIPGLAAGGNNFYPQSKYLLNTAYLRLKNVSIGYTLPRQWLSRFSIKSVRLYVSGENLFTISDLGVPLDPEALDGYSASTGRTFPIQRMYSFGAQIRL